MIEDIIGLLIVIVIQSIVATLQIKQMRNETRKG